MNDELVPVSELGLLGQSASEIKSAFGATGPEESLPRYLS
jgi:hypothetical protein